MRPEQEVPLDQILDRLVICGGVSEVVDRILKLHALTGGFGEIVYAGLDWTVPALARRSMELMATEVVPQVNRALARNT